MTIEDFLEKYSETIINICKREPKIRETLQEILLDLRRQESEALKIPSSENSNQMGLVTSGSGKDHQPIDLEVLGTLAKALESKSPKQDPTPAPPPSKNPTPDPPPNPPTDPPNERFNEIVFKELNQFRQSKVSLPEVQKICKKIQEILNSLKPINTDWLANRKVLHLVKDDAQPAAVIDQWEVGKVSDVNEFWQKISESRQPTVETADGIRPYDLILIDIDLGGDSNFKEERIELVQKAKSEFAVPAVVVFSEQCKPEDIRKALAKGATHFVVKDHAENTGLDFNKFLLRVCRAAIREQQLVQIRHGLIRRLVKDQPQEIEEVLCTLLNYSLGWFELFKPSIAVLEFQELPKGAKGRRPVVPTAFKQDPDNVEVESDVIAGNFEKLKDIRGSDFTSHAQENPRITIFGNSTIQIVCPIIRPFNNEDPSNTPLGFLCIEGTLPGSRIEDEDLAFAESLASFIADLFVFANFPREVQNQSTPSSDGERIAEAMIENPMWLDNYERKKED